MGIYMEIKLTYVTEGYIVKLHTGLVSTNPHDIISCFKNSLHFGKLEANKPAFTATVNDVFVMALGD